MLKKSIQDYADEASQTAATALTDAVWDEDTTLSCDEVIERRCGNCRFCQPLKGTEATYCTGKCRYSSDKQPIVSLANDYCYRDFEPSDEAHLRARAKIEELRKTERV